MRKEIQREYKNALKTLNIYLSNQSFHTLESQLIK